MSRKTGSKGLSSDVWRFWNSAGERESQNPSLKTAKPTLFQVPSQWEAPLMQEAQPLLLKSRWWCGPCRLTSLGSASPSYLSPRWHTGWDHCLGLWGGSCQLSIILWAGRSSVYNCPTQKLHTASSGLRGLAWSAQSLWWPSVVFSPPTRREGTAWLQATPTGESVSANFHTMGQHP